MACVVMVYVVNGLIAKPILLVFVCMPTCVGEDVFVDMRVDVCGCVGVPMF